MASAARNLEHDAAKRRRTRLGVLACALACSLPSCAPSPRTWTADSSQQPVATAAGDSARAASNATTLRVAVLPFANYTPQHDAPQQIAPMVAAEIGAKPGWSVIDPGAVEAALANEPWMLLDRVPPDLVERIATSTGADALVVGALQAYGYRESAADQVPQVSLSLRLVTPHGARIAWSGVHSRDGDDGEWLFGFGRVRSLQQLAAYTVHEVLETFPAPAPEWRRTVASQQGKVSP